MNCDADGIGPISEGWVKVPTGKTVDHKGKPLLITLKGKVEAFYR